MEYRLEKDSLGEVKVPAGAYWGGQTQRAVENFPVCGRTLPVEMVWAMATIKKAAALVNAELGLLDPAVSAAVCESADEVTAGRHDDQFVVDIYQAGAGTSFNMNVNEVIANLAGEKLGGVRGRYELVSPNDHVNMA
ncbi:MAG: aspartate ammonia-lyase, partial [Candidatus Glassbacteria bacterium]|nr:aspartate ammonia-lyase [Candidatus Glassbacteria bacterium]